MVSFTFGENWQRYFKDSLDEGRVNIAKEQLLRFLELPTLSGRTFLDVGCGSGIHSLAALQAGAVEVVSFDLDPGCVAAANSLRDGREAEKWRILEGSILDRDFIGKLGQFDLVYAWGVLHHTGRMWEAVRLAISLVRPGGLFCVALYTTSRYSGFWLRVKQRYNSTSRLGKWLMEWTYMIVHLTVHCLWHLKSPWQRMREHRELRGMDYRTDVRDWLGGYPFETARVEEVLNFCRREGKSELININTQGACTEYLFCRR